MDTRPKSKFNAEVEINKIVTGMNKMCDEMKNLHLTVTQFRKEITEEINANINANINALSDKIDQKFHKQNKKIKGLTEEVTLIQAQTKKLDRQMNEVSLRNEQHEKRLSVMEEELRKPNIVIKGIAEEKVDNLKQRVLKWLNELGLDKIFNVMDLTGVYRLGYRRQTGQIRNVLVKFANVADKAQVMMKIRENAETALKIEGREIHVYQDISKEERSWRYFLKPITKLLRDKGIRYNWRPPQLLKFFYNNRMRTITPQIDPVQYLVELNLLEKEEIQIFKMGGIQAHTSTPKEEGEVLIASDLKTKPKRKRETTKDFSSSLAEIQKKSREHTGEGAKMLVSDSTSEDEDEDSSECEQDQSLPVQLQPDLC